MTISLIVPAYNESKNIGYVLKDLESIAKNVVVVDDGSKDNTYDIAFDSGVYVLKNIINMGGVIMSVILDMDMTSFEMLAVAAPKTIQVSNADAPV